MAGTPPPPPPFGSGPPPPFGDAPGASYPPGYGSADHAPAGYGAPGYGAPGYGPPGYGPPPGFAPARPTNGMAIASMVLGILAVPLCFLGVPALLAVVFGLVGITQCNRDRNIAGRGMAIAGLVLGALSLLLIVVTVIWLNSLDPTTWDLSE